MRWWWICILTACIACGRGGFDGSMNGSCPSCEPTGAASPGRGDAGDDASNGGSGGSNTNANTNDDGVDSSDDNANGTDSCTTNDACVQACIAEACVPFSTDGGPCEDTLDCAIGLACDAGICSTVAPTAIPGFVSALSFPALSDPIAAELEDLDGDGRDDVVVLGAPGVLRVLLARADGSFAPQPPLDLEFAASGMVSGRFTDDTIRDLVIADAENARIVTYAGIGDGSFTTTSARGTTQVVENLHAIDFDGDGFLDIVASRPASESAAVYFGNSAGAFPASQSVGGSPGMVNAIPGDFAGDARLDLLTLGEGPEFSAGVCENTGSLQAPSPVLQELTGLELPARASAGDVDGDGALDVLIPTVSGGLFAFRRGDSGLEALSLPAVSAQLSSATVLDLDGANGPEIATAGFSDELVVLRSTGTGTYALHSYLAGSNPVFVLAGDVNADSRNDVVTVNDDSGDVSVYLGDGVGGLAAPTHLSTGSRSLAGLEVADVNGDGWPDVVAAAVNDQSFEIFFGSSSGLSAPTSVRVESGAGAPNPLSIVTGDLNRDGRLDVVVGNATTNDVVVFHQRTDGGFDAQQELALSGELRHVQGADLNADGFLDLVSANGPGQSVAVLLGNASGLFEPPSSIPVPGEPERVVIANFDGDALLDLAIARSASSAWALVMDATASPNLQSIDGVAAQSTIATGHFDDDTHLDVLVGNRVAGTLEVYFGDGSAGFTAGPVSAIAQRPGYFAVADLNDDGFDDVLAGANGAIWLNLGDGRFALAARYTFPGNEYAIVDLDRDGARELIATKLGGGAGGAGLIVLKPLESPPL